jgi:hypothetical protein
MLPLVDLTGKVYRPVNRTVEPQYFLKKPHAKTAPHRRMLCVFYKMEKRELDDQPIKELFSFPPVYSEQYRK